MNRASIAFCLVIGLLALTSSTTNAQTTAPRPTITATAQSARPTSQPVQATNEAETNTRSPKATTRPLASGRAEEIKKEVAEKRQELNESNKENTRNLARNMITRLDAAHDRQSQITARLQSRIQKLKDQRINVTALERQVTTLNTTLTQQEGLIEALMPTLDEVISNRDTKSVQTFQESVKKVTDQLKKSHELIKTLASDIRKLSPAASVSATSAAQSPRPTSTSSASPKASSTPRVTTRPEAAE